MQFLIVLSFTLLVFGICFAVFAFKGRKAGEAARLHTCGGDETACQCRGKEAPRCSERPPFDLQDTLAKARHIE